MKHSKTLALSLGSMAVLFTVWLLPGCSKSTTTTQGGGGGGTVTGIAGHAGSGTGSVVINGTTYNGFCIGFDSLSNSPFEDSLRRSFDWFDTTYNINGLLFKATNPAYPFAQGGLAIIDCVTAQGADTTTHGFEIFHMPWGSSGSYSIVDFASNYNYLPYSYNGIYGENYPENSVFAELVYVKSGGWRGFTTYTIQSGTLTKTGGSSFSFTATATDSTNAVYQIKGNGSY